MNSHYSFYSNLFHNESRSTEKNLLPLTSDLVFKAVYGRDTPECKRAMIAVLNLILTDLSSPIKELMYLNPFVYGEHPKDKLIILDIKAVLDTGDLVDIEMQVGETAVFVNRTLYYGAKLLTEHLASGEGYATIKKTIVVSIAADRLFPQTKQSHTVFRLAEHSDCFEMTDQLEFHYLELSKIDWMEMTALERLGAYLKYAADPKMEDYIEQLLEFDEGVIAMSEEILRQVSADDRLRELEEARQKYILLQRSERCYAERISEARGQALGEARLVALNLKLIEDGRMEDLKKALTDEAYRTKLYQIYSI